MKKLFLVLLSLGMASIFSANAQTPTSPISPQKAAVSITAPSVEKNSDAPRVWNFENADIKTVINAVSKETGKNFIVDPRVQGKVTLISNSPMDKDEVYEVFLTLLQTYGFLVIPDGGNIFKIVPDSIAKYQDIPSYSSTGKPVVTGSAVMVKVIPVKNGTAEQFVGLLRPLIPTSSEISAYAPTNSLIMSSTANKISEIEKIIHTLDTPNPGAIEVIPMRYADAKDIASAIKSMMPPTPLGKTPTLIAADSSSNSILISGSPQDRANIKTLIKRMDRLTVDAAKINKTVVVNLRYLNAKDFAPILQNVAASMSGTPIPNAGAGASTSSSSSSNDMGSANTLSTIRGLYADTGKSSSSTSTSSYSPTSSSSSSSGESGGVHVQAEPTTNSLIIDGSPAQINSLKTIIAKLDVRPQQVLVEAFIAEVNESEMQKLGIQWGTLPPSGGPTPVTPTNTTNSTTGGSSTVPTFDAGFSTITGGLGVGIVDVGRIKTLITAIKNDSSTNILSTPSLVVLDNEQAEIKVGQKASFNTGSFQNLAAGGGVVNQTETQDVALTLKVTPQIAQNGAIRLKLEHQNDVLTNQIQNGNPIVNDSQFSTDVMINSGQILVIGGLISNDTEEGLQKVPFLGSIPLIGRLFQYRNDSVTKKNLLIFLRPVVLDNQNMSNKETISRYTMIRNIQLDRQRNADFLLPKTANAVLPHWPYAPLPVPFSQSNT